MSTGATPDPPPLTDAERDLIHERYLSNPSLEELLATGQIDRESYERVKRARDAGPRPKGSATDPSPLLPIAIYSFTITLGGVTHLTQELSARIYAAGCDDSTPSSSGGRVRIAFDREATSREAAVASAIGDLKRAGLEVERVEREKGSGDGS